MSKLSLAAFVAVLHARTDTKHPHLVPDVLSLAPDPQSDVPLKLPEKQSHFFAVGVKWPYPFFLTKSKRGD